MPGPVRIAMSGVAGRMGSLIATLALEDRAFRVVGALESPGHQALGSELGQFLQKPSRQVIITEDLDSGLAEAQVLIEFTTPAATLEHAQAAAARKVAMVIGTTGLTDRDHAALRRLSRRTAIFWSPNMSLGILLVRRMLAEAWAFLHACGLDRETRVAIEETHHIHKKDKPSGTAKQLAEDLGRLFPQHRGRVPIEATREGDVVGIHDVALTFGDEQLLLRHEALSRKIFAQGALVVAKFLVERLKAKPGYYDMDVLCQHLLRSR